MINCIIVDDEQHSLDLLIFYTKQIPFLNIILATTNSIEALVLINEGNVDLAFCDIHMPKVTGIDIAKVAIGKCKLIFITAYEKYALEGYEYEVIDYLLKPVTFPRFLAGAQKALNVIPQKQNQTVENILHSDEKSSDYGLSKREIEIVKYLLINKTAKEIGEGLHISKSTVNKHISNVFKKTNARSKYDIISRFKN